MSSRFWSNSGFVSSWTLALTVSCEGPRMENCCLLHLINPVSQVVSSSLSVCAESPLRVAVSERSIVEDCRRGDT